MLNSTWPCRRHSQRTRKPAAGDDLAACSTVMEHQIYKDKAVWSSRTAGFFRVIVKMFLQEFSLERAIDSAVGDWSEDVQPGQQAEIPCLDF